MFNLTTLIERLEKDHLSAYDRAVEILGYTVRLRETFLKELDNLKMNTENGRPHAAESIERLVELIG